MLHWVKYPTFFGAGAASAAPPAIPASPSGTATAAANRRVRARRCIGQLQPCAARRAATGGRCQQRKLTVSKLGREPVRRQRSSMSGAPSGGVMFQEIFPILSTTDLPRALRFYRDLLGCAQTYRFPPDGEAAYVGLRLGGRDLGISAESTAAPSTARFALCVYADDCDAAVQRLRAEGVKVLAEPVDQPWGERMAEVADPDGNRVIVLSRACAP